MTREGLRFLTVLEGGMKLAPYDDGAGYQTIGVGHLIMDSERYLLSGITEDQGWALLADDCTEAENGVRDNLTEECMESLTPQQVDALVCFTFNTGVGNFRRSGLARCLNAGDFEKVPYEMSKWRRAKGRIMQGLVERRKAEGYLFKTGIYDMHPYSSTGASDIMEIYR